jgi:DNA-directed RNA polymerase subunit RPC12/RpoP
MSEFKFACPVCGQHITADASTSGGQVTCPTCFQKIVVPQAPASADPKFIVAASQVGKPRPLPSGPGAEAEAPVSSGQNSTLVAIALAAGVLAAAGVVLWMFHGKILKTGTPPPETKQVHHKAPPPPPKVYPIPTNVVWSLDLAQADCPETTAAGSVHGSGFFCERATLQGGNLTLRQGPKWPPDLGITVEFFAHQGEELSGKSIEISADRDPPLPKVTLRWKDDAHKAANQKVSSGYALKAAFGAASNGLIPGKIYLALPDDAKSVVAGTFVAEIRKPPAPKSPSAPKPPAPKSGPPG